MPLTPKRGQIWSYRGKDWECLGVGRYWYFEHEDEGGRHEYLCADEEILESMTPPGGAN